MPVSNQMKGLVIGGGSIGTRHLQNLKLLGVESLALVEPSPEQRKLCCAGGLAVGFPELANGLDWGPTFAVIASPSHLHVAHALECAARGIPLFIEKPLSHSEQGLGELANEVRAHRLVSMVGCNMRFHPGPSKVKALLNEARIGHVLFARVQCGSFLPTWRPGRDYRTTYSANAAMGGGCLLDNIHELDLTRWYLGNVSEVFCRAEHLSSLELNVEDVAMLLCRHTSGTMSEIHLDYVQRTYERGCQVVGEGGSIFWDFREGKVRWFDAAKESWQEFPQPKDWDVNQMYVDEMEHFLGCVRTGQDSCFSVSEALEVMNIVFAAKESSRSDRLIPVRRSA